MRDLNPVIRNIALNEIKGLNFCMPAVVVSIERLTDGLIDVAPVIDKFTSTIGYTEYDVIYDVPIVSVNTSTSSIQVPINQGDGVLLIFTQSDASEYLQGLKEAHEPNTNSFLSLDNAVAFIGFNPYQESVYNNNNYKNSINNKSLTIVHNKNTDNEIMMSLNPDGTLGVIANKVDVKCKQADVKADNVNVDASVIDAKNSLIKTENDLSIKGKSVYQFMTSHTHSGVQSGSSNTAPPNPL